MIWIAFIIACTNPACDGTKHYMTKGAFSQELCLQDAHDWAIFAHLQEPKQEYGFGCDKNTYEPKEITK